MIHTVCDLPLERQDKDSLLARRQADVIGRGRQPATAKGREACGIIHKCAENGWVPALHAAAVGTWLLFSVPHLLLTHRELEEACLGSLFCFKSKVSVPLT